MVPPLDIPEQLAKSGDVRFDPSEREIEVRGPSIDALLNMANIELTDKDPLVRETFEAVDSGEISGRRPSMRIKFMA